MNRVDGEISFDWKPDSAFKDGIRAGANRAIRWGLYMDGEVRTVTYTLVPAAGTAISAQLVGEVTFDGEAMIISGDSTINAEGSADLHLPATEIAADGSVKLRLAGPAGQVCELESSTDLVNWTFVTELFLPDGELDYTDLNTDQNSQRYYRLKVR